TLATRPRHHWSQRATPQLPALVPKVKVPASRLRVLFPWPVAGDGKLTAMEMTYWDVPSSVRAQAGETVSLVAGLEDTVRVWPAPAALELAVPASPVPVPASPAASVPSSASTVPPVPVAVP